MKTNWKNRNVLIIGAARQGLALARFLVGQGANVTLNDGREERQLSNEIKQLAGITIDLQFGGHPLSILQGKDLVCISGGVPLTIPLIRKAVELGIPLSNDSQIFFESTDSKVIGITGSAGKTTTTSLLGEMAKRSVKDPQKVWVGGNIGTPLIEYVEVIKPDDIVIVELSSFQLDQMTISPQIAVVTNVTPNHLDRHGTLEEYTAAKSHILTYQSASDTAILNHEDEGAWKLRGLVKGKLFSFGLKPLSPEQDCVFIKNQNVIIQRDGMQKALTSIEGLRILGQHNLYNVLAACATAEIIKLQPKAIQEAINTFKGVPHRLELVSEKHGVRWYNDSIATAPERTLAAIESFTEPIILLLGGKDKNLPWDRLVLSIHQQVDHVVLFGADAQKIEAALVKSDGISRPYSIDRTLGLDDAIQVAYRIAQAGDVVLLSPGATSYDEFKDFEERGERFRLCVHQLP